MNSLKLRKTFLDFFVKRGHIIVPSSSLLPADSSVLFTTAGMQQFSQHLRGEKDAIKDFGSCHLVSCQKCFRSDDIDEIGDDAHHTFFEMLGNWSIGQDEKGRYFKEGAIEFALEFLLNVLGLDKNKFYITIFKGNKDIPRDSEVEKIWLENGISKKRIKEFGQEDNLWGPVAETGVCGPNSEIHYDRGKKFGCKNPPTGGCGPNCSRCKRYVEIWNLVFIQYYKDKAGNYRLLPQKSVDTGMGLERMAAILQGKPSGYETDLFFPIIQEISAQCGRDYEAEKRNFRIIADHVRGSVFLISGGVLPSNVEQGYVLRRLLRRAIRYGKTVGARSDFLLPLAQKVIEVYRDVYPEVQSKQADVLTVVQKEEEKFGKALERGVAELDKLLKSKTSAGWRTPAGGQKSKIIEGKELFDLYQSYGFPLELTRELAKERGFEIDEKGFYEELEKHQEISRAGREKKFGGGGEFSPELHTATHLLHAALRKILGPNVKQMGSDITSERLRFDFSFNRKMNKEEIKKVEDLVNQKIKEDLIVKKEEMSLDEALKSGALAFAFFSASARQEAGYGGSAEAFGVGGKEKYPERVNVYSVGDFSKEICAGPHISRTGKLGKFKIVKEESSAAGVRRIRAVLLG